MKNRSVPVDTVVPHLTYRDIDAAATWLTRVFHFTEHFRYGTPVSGIQMQLAKACIMLHSPREGTSSPADLGFRTNTLTIILDDVAPHYAHAREAGATLVEELHETIYGERQYAATDLDGHLWIFSQHAHDLSPADWGATLAPGSN
jgi:uncharacterized glyoxalase superfamily protein PhnB